jgi:two-component system, OmpR family, sensor histidine kinase MprB
VTQDLSGRIEPSGEDELGRLAVTFNAMLDALEHSMNALDASVHAQRQLVADASHELRTPVTSLRTNIEILQHQGQRMDAAEHDRLLGDVVEQIGQLTLLMNDLIDLARGEQPRSDTEDVRLDQLINEVIERAGRQAPATPLRAELEPTVVTGVPARLERAISNLVDNAIKYTSRGGVSIGLSAVDDEVAVRVCDTGIGIPAENVPYLFDEFYQVNNHERDRSKGFGMGLAICRCLARHIGGDVRLANSGAAGSTFEVVVNRRGIGAGGNGSTTVAAVGSADNNAGGVIAAPAGVGADRGGRPLGPPGDRPHPAPARLCGV